MPSLFTKIIRGEIPSYKIYEDEHTYAFLDIRPIQLGHVIVVPKTEVDYFIDVPEPYYSAVFKTGKVISRAIHEATQCNRVGSMILGFEVPHFHLHLVPLWQMSDMDFKKGKNRPPEEMEQVQKKICERLNRV